VRYSHRGGEVRTTVQLAGDAAPHLLVQVEDEGIGLDPEDAARAFEHRWRSERARHHRADGSGLGLPLARALARSHGGDITLAPRPGGGAIATLTLPLAAAEGAA
jgi:two-component system OmpR family sensor kinase